jgi:hypothetical protein
VKLGAFCPKEWVTSFHSRSASDPSNGLSSLWMMRVAGSPSIGMSGTSLILRRQNGRLVAGGVDGRVRPSGLS